MVCVTISSKLSGTRQAAAQAARSVSEDIPVEVVDSLSVTMGEGLVVAAAAESAGRGATLDAVVAAAESARRRTRVYGIIDTLENLRKGGRIGGAAAALGTLLSIKPVIEVRDGLVEQESKQRTRAKAMRYVADKVAAAGPLDRLGVLNTNAADFEGFLQMVSEVQVAEPAFIADIGPVVSAHAGPGAVGVAWTVPEVVAGG